MVGNIVSSVFTPVLAKHSKSLNLVDSISVGVDRMQRKFCSHTETSGVLAEHGTEQRLGEDDPLRGVYRKQLEVPKHLARRVHDLYFEPNMKSSGRGPRSPLMAGDEQ